MLGIEVPYLIHDRRVSVLCMLGELLYRFGRYLVCLIRRHGCPSESQNAPKRTTRRGRTRRPEEPSEQAGFLVGIRVPKQGRDHLGETGRLVRTKRLSQSL